jgi:lycopene cyclase domain-containing protein
VTRVRELSYLGVLAFVVLGSVWLEVLLRTRVLRRLRRFVLVLACVLPVFVVWDWYAIDAGHWTFDPRRVTGITLPGDLPLEELLFFVVVPFAAVLTFEAVRSVHPHWRAGDEEDQ